MDMLRVDMFAPIWIVLGKENIRIYNRIIRIRHDCIMFPFYSTFNSLWAIYSQFFLGEPGIRHYSNMVPIIQRKLTGVFGIHRWVVLWAVVAENTFKICPSLIPFEAKHLSATAGISAWIWPDTPECCYRREGWWRWRCRRLTSVWIRIDLAIVNIHHRCSRYLY